jgi:hypothetical protein
MAKRIIITSIALIVGGLHFVTGENYRGSFPAFVNGYLIDILLPMTMVLLMGLFQTAWLRSNIFRVCAVFGFGCFVEASQYFGCPVLGSIFDPLDILAYAIGAFLGLVVDVGCFFSTSW